MKLMLFCGGAEMWITIQAYDIDEQIDYREDLLLAVTGPGSDWQLRSAGSHQPESAALLNLNE